MGKKGKEEAVQFKTRAELTAADIKAGVEESLESAHLLLAEDDFEGAMRLIINSQYQMLSLTGRHMYDVVELVQPIIDALEDEDEDVPH